MARTPRSAAEKLAMRKKKSRALLLFNIIAFSVVVIGAVLLCIFVFFKVGNVTFTSDAGYDEADIRRVCGINEGDNLVLLVFRRVRRGLSLCKCFRQGAGDRFTAVRGHDCGARGKYHEHKAQRNDHVRR